MHLKCLQNGSHFVQVSVYWCGIVVPQDMETLSEEVERLSKINC